MNCFAAEAATESRPGLTGVVAQAAKRREKIAQRASAGFVFVHVTAAKGRQICSICRPFAACVRSEIKPRADALARFCCRFAAID